jgi:hypothetical protein
MKYFFLSFLGFILMSNASLAQDNSPIVLELFTSQSCSSCPPADEILGELAEENDNIIALSCHVTYWNHLHWKDTLSQEFCTERQRSYARSFNSKRVYTPQIVINGQHEMVGSRGRSITKAINKEQGKLKTIDLEIQNKQLIIRLPETPGNDSYALTLLTYGDDHTQNIPSGENRGRTISYTNPVSNIKSLGTWDGTGKTMDIDISDLKNVSGYVVLAQKNGVTGHIFAAGKSSL